MEISDFRKERQQLEEYLHSIISQAVSNFQNKTGVPVSHISVTITPVNTDGEKETTRFFMNVHVETKL